LATSDSAEPKRKRQARQRKHKARQDDMAAALRDSERRFRFLYEENPSMYFTVDTAGTVLSVNPFGASQLGYAAADLVGQSVLQVFHPEDKEAVRRQLAVCIANPGQAFTWELRKVRGDGHVLWVREVARAVRDRNGRVIVLVVCEDITNRKAVEEELRRAHDEMEQRVTERTAELQESQRDLRLLAGRLLTAQEDERRHLAREMHDDLTQRLAGIAMQAGRLERLRATHSEEARVLTRDIRQALSRLSTDVHALSRRLHPSILDDLGLVEVLESECAAFAEQTRVAVDFTTSGMPDEIDRNVAVCLYRITQEALRNVVKHADTEHARVALVADDAGLTLTIEDRGVGFDVTRGRGVGLGLASMGERARLIRADLAVESRHGGGCRVRVRVPWSAGPGA